MCLLTLLRIILLCCLITWFLIWVLLDCVGVFWLWNFDCVFRWFDVWFGYLCVYYSVLFGVLKWFVLYVVVGFDLFYEFWLVCLGCLFSVCIVVLFWFGFVVNLVVLLIFVFWMFVNVFVIGNFACWWVFGSVYLFGFYMFYCGCLCPVGLFCLILDFDFGGFACW